MPNTNNPYINAGGASFSEARGFTGVDLWDNPQLMPPDKLLAADNVVDIGGDLYARAGEVGLFGGNAPSLSSSSPNSSSSSSSLQYNDVGAVSYAIPTGPCYDLCSFVDSDGYTWLLFVDGAGKLRKTLQGSGCHQELTDVGGASYSFNGFLSSASILDGFAYISDSAHSSTRVNLNGGFPAYAMIAPSQSPNAQLTNSLLFPIAQVGDAANWSFDGQTTADTNLLASYGLFNAAGNGWKSHNMFAAGVDQIQFGGDGWVTPGGTDQTGAFLAVPHLTGNVLLYPSRFHVVFSAIKGTPSPNTANVVLTAYDSGHNQIGIVTHTFGDNVAAGTMTLIDEVFDFSGVGPNVAYLMLTVYAGIIQGGKLMNMATPMLTPITVQTQLLSGASAVKVIPTISGGALTSSSSSSSATSSSSSGSGTIVSTLPGDLGNTLDYIGTSLTFTFPATSSSSSLSGTSSSSGQLVGGIDLSNVDRLIFGIAGASSWEGLAFALYLKRVDGTYILADNGTAFSSDLTGLDCDISTLTAAQRTNIVAFKLTFLTDPIWSSPFYALQIGAIYSGGNLSIGDAPYNYWVTETAVIDSTNKIESNPSPASGATSSGLIPTFFQSEASIQNPSDCKKNAPANECSLWRGGGAWDDVRLIATVTYTVSVPYGSDPLNPFYGWDAVTKTWTDNTPDLFLSLARIISFSRDPFPANVEAQAIWQGRRWGSVGNKIYGGWLSNTDNSAALMTTLIIDPSDPNVTISGCTFPVSADPSDTVVALVPFGTPVAAGNQFGGGLVVFNKRSIFIVQGTDPTNFTSRQYDYIAGVGLVARRGYVRVGANEIIFMGPDRLHVFPPAMDSPFVDIGRPIQPAIYPSAPRQTTFQNSAAFAKSWTLYHDSKLFLGVPQPGSASPDVIWVYDMMMHGWTRWVSQAMTSAHSAPPNAVSGAAYQLYLWGANGQLFALQGTVDQANPLAATAAIPITITVHGLRPGFFYKLKSRPLFYRLVRLERIEFEFIFNGTVTFRAQAWNAGPTGGVAIAGASTSRSYTLTGKGRGATMNVPSGAVEGEYITLTLTASATGPAILRGLRAWLTQTSEEAAG